MALKVEHGFVEVKKEKIPWTAGMQYTGFF
jgi:hypothetical protein